MQGPIQYVRITLYSALVGIVVVLVILCFAGGVIHVREVHGQDKRDISFLTNVLKPQLSFRMSTGNGPSGPVSSSFSKKAAFALWDAMCASVRLQPTLLKPNVKQTRGIHDR